MLFTLNTYASSTIIACAWNKIEVHFIEVFRWTMLVEAEFRRKCGTINKLNRILQSFLIPTRFLFTIYINFFIYRPHKIHWYSFCDDMENVPWKTTHSWKFWDNRQKFCSTLPWQPFLLLFAFVCNKNWFEWLKDEEKRVKRIVLADANASSNEIKATCSMRE